MTDKNEPGSAGKGGRGRESATLEQSVAIQIVNASARESKAKGLTLSQAADAAEEKLKTVGVQHTLDHTQITLLVMTVYSGH